MRVHSLVQILQLSGYTIQQFKKCLITVIGDFLMDYSPALFWVRFHYHFHLTCWSQGKDVIGLAETGSGKTGAFALPILQSLLASPQRLHTLVLTPTRELAFQISEQFEALGSSIGVKCGMCSLINSDFCGFFLALIPFFRP